MPIPRPGDLVRVAAAASVQFAGERAIWFRVIKLPGWDTYHGRIWLDGYELGEKWEAIERRTIFVQAVGLRIVKTK